MSCSISDTTTEPLIYNQGWVFRGTLLPIRLAFSTDSIGTSQKALQSCFPLSHQENVDQLPSHCSAMWGQSTFGIEKSKIFSIELTSTEMDLGFGAWDGAEDLESTFTHQ
jgi:hypothetical protein